MNTASLHESPRVEPPALPGFVALTENLSPIQAIQRMAADVSAGQGTTPLFLHGSPGSGKSHLVGALADTVVGARADALVRLLSANDLGRDSEWSEPADCDLLIVEDLQFLSKPAADPLALLLDRQADQGGTWVCTANTSPWRLDASARLANRLVGGLVIDLPTLAAGSRRQLLAALARRTRLSVPAEVLDWLAEQLTGNGRALVGALQQLEMLARMGRRLDLNTVRELWSDQVDASRPTLERIVRRIADQFGLDARQLAARGRRHSALLPRQLSMYLARRLTKLTLGEIGQFFGQRDHTTVLHACRKIDASLGADLVLASTVHQLCADLA